jgi:anti-sigma factor RsiW
MNDLASETKCQADDVAAYLDGELSHSSTARFEDHLKSCDHCARELRAQRQLLCTLDVAFNDSRSFALPQDFARIVTTRAESDFSGMRRRPERRRALKLCAVLALVSFALMGAASRAIVFEPVRSFFKAGSTVLDLCWQAASEVAASTAVIIRVVSRAVFFSHNGAGLLLLLVFPLAISCLLFLITRYHRAQVVE